MKKRQFSALHRIASDEIWHFYAGGAVEIFVIDIEGNLIVHKLGRYIKGNEALQCIVPSGSWFGARTAQGAEFSLAGCTVAPGFDFADFEMGHRKQLIESFLHLKRTIELLTH